MARRKAVPGQARVSDGTDPMPADDVIDTSPEGLPEAKDVDPTAIRSAKLTADGWVVPATPDQLQG